MDWHVSICITIIVCIVCIMHTRKDDDEMNGNDVKESEMREKKWNERE